jgi:hypothetical protein
MPILITSQCLGIVEATTRLNCCITSHPQGKRMLISEEARPNRSQQATSYRNTHNENGSSALNCRISNYLRVVGGRMTMYFPTSAISRVQ